MKTRNLFLLGLATLITNVLLSQSLESQLKIIFGDALSTYGKSDFSRFLGKALSTSGNMNYNMEMIKAQNNQTITINLPPNTYLGPNHEVLPNSGYQWANPSNPTDFGVLPLPTYSNATLPPYDFNYLQANFSKGFNDSFNKSSSTLNVLFTYNWQSDFNGDGLINLSEFNNIKRTFYKGEPVSFAFNFAVRCGRSLVKDWADKVSFLMQIFEGATGKLIAKEDYNYYDDTGHYRYENRVYYRSLGNCLPVGKYLIAVSITSQDHATRKTIQLLKEYFEIIDF